MAKGASPSPPQADAKKPAAASAAPPAGSLSRFAFLLSGRWLLGLAGAALLIQGGVFFWHRAKSAPPPRSTVHELKLGSFEYGRFNTREKKFQRGKFDLTVRLTDSLGAAEHRQVDHQEQRFQDAVEETLRRARAADFADPRFTRLRNQIQQRLNDELGFDWVDEVVVSNPMVEKSKDDDGEPSADDLPPGPTEPADSPPSPPSR